MRTINEILGGLAVALALVAVPLATIALVAAGAIR